MMHANAYTTRLLKSFRNKQTRSVFAILIGASLVIGLTTYLSERLSDRRNPIERRVNMSVFNHGSSGAMAFRELLENLRIPTGTIMRSTDRFDAETESKSAAGVLIFFEPEAPLEKKEILYFEKLSEKGINIIVFTSGEEKIAGIMRTLSTDHFPKIREGMYLSDVKSETSKLQIIPAAGIRKSFALMLPAKKRFRTYHRDWEVLARDAQGIFMVRKALSRGFIILASDSEFASNRFIGKAENGLFMYGLASVFSGNNAIFFDEYHHGYNRRFTLLYFIARKDYALFIAHLAIFFTIYVAGALVRFGRTRQLHEGDKDRIFFFTRGMAALLAKRRFAAELAGMLAHLLSIQPSAKRDATHKRNILLSKRLREKISLKTIRFKDIKKTLDELRREEHGNQRIRRKD